MVVSQGDIREMFSEQDPATLDQPDVQELRERYEDMGLLLLRLCPPSDDRASALRKLRESFHAALDSILMRGAY